MTFAKCLELNGSARSMKRISSEFELPKNERAPIYRRQVGPVFSVEYSGEARLNYSDRESNVRPGLHGCLF